MFVKEELAYFTNSDVILHLQTLNALTLFNVNDRKNVTEIHDS